MVEGEHTDGSSSGDYDRVPSHRVRGALGVRRVVGRVIRGNVCSNSHYLVLVSMQMKRVSVGVPVDDLEVNHLILLQNVGVSLRTVNSDIVRVVAHCHLSEERRNLGHLCGEEKRQYGATQKRRGEKRNVR
jgi:hypothetical protein